MLDKETLEKLSQPLDAKRVKHRAGGGGMQLSYIKGHDAIDTANRIFGYGNWGYDLQGVELQTVHGENDDIIGGYYAARVKLTVAGCVPITEEGVCPIQEGRNPRAKIDAHDMARKGAITDAMKRALRCFGDQFGNGLYENDAAQNQPRENGRQGQGQPQGQADRPAAPAPAQSKPAAAQARPASATTPAAGVTGELATEQQRQAILKMAARREMGKPELEGRLAQLYGYGLDRLTKDQASHFIKVFQDQQA
jgi:DNA recombination protein Rad52